VTKNDEAILRTLLYADVSGLGESKKPHLGDLAWSAGINFEF